jgi:hypothetical protein
MMRPLLKLAFTLSAVSVAAVAAGMQAPAPGQEITCHGCLTYYRNPEGKTNLLEDVGLDRDEGARTILLDTSGYDKLYLVIFYTYATATDIFVKLSCSADNSNYAPRSQDSLESGGTNQRFLLSYDVSGCKSTRIVLSASTDASGSDVVTVQAVGQSTAKPETVLPVQ